MNIKITVRKIKSARVKNKYYFGVGRLNEDKKWHLLKDQDKIQLIYPNMKKANACAKYLRRELSK